MAVIAPAPTAACNMTLDQHALESSLGDLIDDNDFHELDERLSQFNMFEAMGAVRGELRHSNFLDFIFSPNRSHGLGARVLEKTLRSILENIAPSDRPVRTLELVVSDLDDAVVHRERDSIDLVIEVRSLNLIVLIENKVGAMAGEGQLQRYKEVIEHRFPKLRHLFVFLTPDGTEPDHSAYVAYSYRSLSGVLDSISSDESFSTDSRTMLRHYVEMLRRHIVPDEHLQEMALRLYERHREAFEFVFKCRPEPKGLLDVVLGCIREVSELLEDRPGANLIRFAPTEWEDIPALKCNPTEWTHSGRGMLFEVKSHPDTGRVHLVLMMGPCEPAVRMHIYDAATKRSLFKGLVKPMGQKSATLYNRELLTQVQAQRMDFEARCAAVSAAWSEFQQHDLLPLVTEISAIAMTPGKMAPPA